MAEIPICFRALSGKSNDAGLVGWYPSPKKLAPHLHAAGPAHLTPTSFCVGAPGQRRSSRRPPHCQHRPTGRKARAAASGSITSSRSRAEVFDCLSTVCARGDAASRHRYSAMSSAAVARNIMHFSTSTTVVSANFQFAVQIFPKPQDVPAPLPTPATMSYVRPAESPASSARAQSSRRTFRVDEVRTSAPFKRLCPD